MPENGCSTSGLIILEVAENELVVREFVEKLNAIEQVTAKHLYI